MADSGFGFAKPSVRGVCVCGANTHGTAKLKGSVRAPLFCSRNLMADSGFGFAQPSVRGVWVCDANTHGTAKLKGSVRAPLLYWQGCAFAPPLGMLCDGLRAVSPQSLLQLDPQPRSRPRQPRHNGANRQTCAVGQRAGGRFSGHNQLHQLTLWFGQPRDCRKRVGAIQTDQGVGLGDPMIVFQLLGCLHTPAPARPVGQGTHGVAWQIVNPVARAQTLAQAQQRVLHQILGLCRAARKASRTPVQDRDQGHKAAGVWVFMFHHGSKVGAHGTVENPGDSGRSSRAPLFGQGAAHHTHPNRQALARGSIHSDRPGCAGPVTALTL